MKICLINNLYKPYARGGAEKIVEMTAEEFKKQGQDVVVISTKPENKFSIFPATAGPRLPRQGGGNFSRHSGTPPRRWQFFPPQRDPACPAEAVAKAVAINNDSLIKNYQILSLYFNLSKMPVWLRFFWHVFDMFDIGSFLIIRKILKKEKIDLVITHNLKGAGYLIPLAIKSLSIKHLHTLHDIQLLHPSGLMIYGKEKIIDSLFARIYSFFCRALFGSPAVVISPSKWLLEEHKKRGFFKNSEQQVLPNPINKEINPISRESWKKETNTAGKHLICFLYVGQIEKHKGIIFLIKTFKNLGENNCELVIAGSGSKIEEIKNIAKGLDNIKILGRKNLIEIKELMSSSDCLIVPSLCYENSPTVIYEASESGLPVIASNIGGIPEIINNPKLLFNPNNEDSLIACLRLAIRGIESQVDLLLKKDKVEINTSQYIKTILELTKKPSIGA